MNEALRALIDMLVPASADGRMPSAAEIPQVLQHAEEVAARTPAIRRVLDLLDTGSTTRRGVPFAAADAADRAAVLDDLSAREPDALRQLALETVTCYYQQDAVLERLGLEARPPFPKGYQVLSGDLTLLQAVRARGRLWRDAGDA